MNNAENKPSSNETVESKNSSSREASQQGHIEFKPFDAIFQFRLPQRECAAHLASSPPLVDGFSYYRCIDNIPARPITFGAWNGGRPCNLHEGLSQPSDDAPGFEYREAIGTNEAGQVLYDPDTTWMAEKEFLESHVRVPTTLAAGAPLKRFGFSDTPTEYVGTEALHDPSYISRREQVAGEPLEDFAKRIQQPMNIWYRDEMSNSGARTRQKLVAELADLVERNNDLQSLLDHPRPDDISRTQWALLHVQKQVQYMELQILNHRLTYWDEEISDELLAEIKKQCGYMLGGEQMVNTDVSDALFPKIIGDFINGHLLKLNMSNDNNLPKEELFKVIYRAVQSFAPKFPVKKSAMMSLSGQSTDASRLRGRVASLACVDDAGFLGQQDPSVSVAERDEVEQPADEQLTWKYPTPKFTNGTYLTLGKVQNLIWLAGSDDHPLVKLKKIIVTGVLFHLLDADNNFLGHVIASHNDLLTFEAGKCDITKPVLRPQFIFSNAPNELFFTYENDQYQLSLSKLQVESNESQFYLYLGEGRLLDGATDISKTLQVKPVAYTVSYLVDSNGIQQWYYDSGFSQRLLSELTEEERQRYRHQRFGAGMTLEEVIQEVKSR